MLFKIYHRKNLLFPWNEGDKLEYVGEVGATSFYDALEKSNNLNYLVTAKNGWNDKGARSTTEGDIIESPYAAVRILKNNAFKNVSCFILQRDTEEDIEPVYLTEMTLKQMEDHEYQKKIDEMVFDQYCC